MKCLEFYLSWRWKELNRVTQFLTEVDQEVSSTGAVPASLDAH